MEVFSILKEGPNPESTAVKYKKISQNPYTIGLCQFCSHSACRRHRFGISIKDMGTTTGFWKVLKDSFAILRVKNIRIYMFGQFISLVGDWMQTTAQAWLVWEMTHKATALGIVALLSGAP